MTRKTTTKTQPKARIMGYREFLESRQTKPSTKTIVEASNGESTSRRRAKIIAATARKFSNSKI